MEFHKVKKGILKLIPQPRLSSFVITPNFDPDLIQTKSVTKVNKKMI